MSLYRYNTGNRNSIYKHNAKASTKEEDAREFCEGQEVRFFDGRQFREGTVTRCDHPHYEVRFDKGTTTIKDVFPSYRLDPK